VNEKGLPQPVVTTSLKCRGAAIPQALLESELFGHEKGAFTGAQGKRVGKFEQCHGGTLFPRRDRRHAAGDARQAPARLEERAFQRVGGKETIQTDMRQLAATHRQLTAWSAEGKF
jgi:two-component system nitrogen regulation response regulator GlnG